MLNAVNKYYNNVNYVLPKNYDYVNRQNDVKKTYNFRFDGDIMEISKWYTQNKTFYLK